MMKQTDMKEVEKLFSLGAHLGHKKSRLHPKARKNVYSIVNSTSIIDLTKTVEQLKKAQDRLSDAAKKGEVILVVATKKIANSFIKDYCNKNEVPNITSKWLPGLMTNFETIVKNVEKLKDMKTKRDNGTWDGLVKHERTKLSKEIVRLEKLYGGIAAVSKRPDLIFILDPKKEKNALKEALKYKIPIVALVDTNSDPDPIDFPVVANDDTDQVVEYIMKSLLDAYIKTEKPKKEEKKEEKADVKTTKVN